VGDPGSLRDGQKGLLGDQGVGEVQVGDVDQAGKQELESFRRQTAALVEREAFQVGQSRGKRRGGGQGLKEEGRKGLGGTTAKVDGVHVGQTKEQLLQDLDADVAFHVLLEQTFPEVGQKVQALQQGPGSKILNLSIHLLGATQTDRREVGEVEPTDKGSQGGILSQMVETLGKDNRVGESHVAVQHTEGGGVQRAGGQEARN